MFADEFSTPETTKFSMSSIDGASSDSSWSNRGSLADGVLTSLHVEIPKPLFANRKQAGTMYRRDETHPPRVKTIFVHVRPLSTSSLSSSDSVSSATQSHSSYTPPSPGRLRRRKTPAGQNLRVLRQKDSWEDLRKAMEFGVNEYLEGSLSPTSTIFGGFF